jgi:PKD repeat protein
LKNLNVIYCLRIAFGILAAIVASLVVDLRFGDPLINGITIALAIYLVSYYLLKWQFMNKVEKASKILTMGIGAYFLVFIACWVFIITPFLAPPTATFTWTPQNPIVGQTVTFNTTSEDPDGDIEKYLWNFGDGGTSELKEPTHIYSTSGEYTVRLTVTDDHGISSGISIPLEVRIES